MVPKDTKVFFAKIDEARDLRAKDIKNIVVLVDSKEEGSTAITEGFKLALREYHWEKEIDGEKKNFNGFQFFADSEETALKILSIALSHGIIPKEEPTRVTFGIMPEGVSLRWLAERIILEN